MITEKYCSCCGIVTLFLNNNCLCCESGFNHIVDYDDNQLKELDFS